MKVYFISTRDKKNINKKKFEKYREYLESILEDLYLIYVKHRDDELKKVSQEIARIESEYKNELKRYNNLIKEQKQIFEEYTKLKLVANILHKIYNLVKSGKVSDKYREKLLYIIENIEDKPLSVLREIDLKFN